MFALTVSFPLFTVAYTPPPRPWLPALALNVAVYPSMLLLCVIMFSIPPTPSASYFGPGFVITSIRLMLLAGMLFSTSLGLLLIIWLGLLFT